MKEKQTPTEYILGLINTFPCLKPKVTRAACLDPADNSFDADRFMAQFACASTGEILCATFIVNVWNPGYAKKQGWDFNLFDFMGTADSGNRHALFAWLASPFWP